MGVGVGSGVGVGTGVNVGAGVGNKVSKILPGVADGSTGVLGVQDRNSNTAPNTSATMKSTSMMMTCGAVVRLRLLLRFTANFIFTSASRALKK